MDTTTKKTVFLSYSRCDIAYADEIADCLKKAGVDVWVDRSALEVGDPLAEKIKNAIANRDHVVALLSNRSAKSRWVKVELAAAFEKGSDVILPVLLPGLKTVDVPLELQGRVYADFRKDKEDAIKMLLRKLVPDHQLLMDYLDPFRDGRLVGLIGTSTVLYQTGRKWSNAPAGSAGALFTLQNAISSLFQTGREVLWNYPEPMLLEAIRSGDNVYAIGAPKVNKFTAGFLAQSIRPGLGCVWFVGRSEWSDRGLFYALRGCHATYRPTINRVEGQGTGLDFGLILWARGLQPHGRFTLVVAGCHTSATHASAFAASNTDFYRRIAETPEAHAYIERRSDGLWAIIQVDSHDFAPDLSSIRIVESGTMIIGSMNPDTFTIDGEITWDDEG